MQAEVVLEKKAGGRRLNNEVILKMEHITKEFSGVKVLKDVSFTLRKGTVHALMGENGAGKSTLMKILNGIYKRTSGDIYLHGKKVEISSSQDSKALGIAMIHQELSAFSDLSVAANMFMGREVMNKSSLFMNKRKMNEECQKIFNKIGISINPKSIIGELSVAETQLVEIAKAVSSDAEIIVMDEPTSAITETEVEKLFKIIEDLKAEGKAIIYISHKMDEIFRISDEITVLRDGTFVGSDLSENLNHDKLITMMVGRALQQQFHKTENEIGEVLLEVRGLSREGKFKDINFQVRRGEILGIAGLMGAGRSEVVESVFGLMPKTAGEIYFKGKKAEIKKPKDAIDLGISFVSEDRKLVGLNLIGSLKENITLANLQDYCLGRSFIKRRMEESVSDEYIRKLNIRTTGREKLAGQLSGGNQQKVVLARWMSINPELLIMDEPTRGIDVGAKAEIYRLMDDFAKAGNSVIMISSEMPEVLAMSDRVLVMCEGEVTGSFNRDEVTQEKIMKAAAGL